MLSEFLHSLKGIFVNNRFLGVGYDLPFFFRKMDGFLNLEADKCAFEINSTTRVLTVFKNMPNSYLIPPIWVIRSLVCCLSADTIIIFGRADNFLAFQTPCNLHRSKSRKTQLKDISNNLCGRLVNNPLFRIIGRFHIPERNCGRYTLSVICFGLPNCLYLFTRLLSIPLVENIVERHHFKSRTRIGIYILLNSNKGYSK